MGLGCAATRSGPSRKQQEYLTAHPLSPDEERRLLAREIKSGDTLERVRITLDDCALESVSREGDFEIFTLHLPIDSRRARVVTDKLEELEPGSNAQLTFEHGRLKSLLTL